MKVSHILTLIAGGFISAGYHTMNDPQKSSFYMFIGIGSLILASIISGRWH